MKSYPSISKSIYNFPLYTFDKLDGSNLRFEYSKKRGWYKFGTRHRLFDSSDEEFGNAIELFNNTLNEPLTKICKDNRWESVVVFAEYYGKNSFAGLHIKDEPKYLSVFDISIYKQGILPPVDFLKLFEDVVLTPKYLGKFNSTTKFFQNVFESEINGITFEGVVGKTLLKNKLIMSKAKTKQ